MRQDPRTPASWVESGRWCCRAECPRYVDQLVVVDDVVSGQLSPQRCDPLDMIDQVRLGDPEFLTRPPPTFEMYSSLNSHHNGGTVATSPMHGKGRDDVRTERRAEVRDLTLRRPHLHKTTPFPALNGSFR
jgi:hypothetical protein